MGNIKFKIGDHCIRTTNDILVCPPGTKCTIIDGPFEPYNISNNEEEVWQVKLTTTSGSESESRWYASKLELDPDYTTPDIVKYKYKKKSMLEMIE
jgi:hypothetical protein